MAQDSSASQNVQAKSAEKRTCTTEPPRSIDGQEDSEVQALRLMKKRELAGGVVRKNLGDVQRPGQAGKDDAGAEDEADDEDHQQRVDWC